MSIKRYDIVRLTRFDRVGWVSGPASRPATPRGNWIVVAGVEGDKFLLAKDETLIKIPIEDVFKVADYDLNEIITTIKMVRTSDDLKKFANLEMNNVKENRGNTTGNIEDQGHP